MGLRERHKSRRRAEIVAAAARLWRERGVGHVGLQEIAAAAEVAPQTVHNLIGAHEALVLAVIGELLDRLDTALGAIETARGVDRAIEAAMISAALFTADAALYRQLIVRVPTVLFAGGRGLRDSAKIQIEALRSAQQDGDIRSNLSVETAGRTIYHNYLGALHAWGAGEIGDEGFTAAAELAALTTLAACATPRASMALSARLDAAMARAAHAGGTPPDLARSGDDDRERRGLRRRPRAGLIRPGKPVSRRMRRTAAPEGAALCGSWRRRPPATGGARPLHRPLECDVPLERLRSGVAAHVRRPLALGVARAQGLAVAGYSA